MIAFQDTGDGAVGLLGPLDFTGGLISNLFSASTNSVNAVTSFENTLAQQDAQAAQQKTLVWVGLGAVLLVGVAVVGMSLRRS